MNWPEFIFDPSPEGYEYCDICYGAGGDITWINVVERRWYPCEECDGTGLKPLPDWAEQEIIRAEMIQETGPLGKERYA